MSNIFTPIALNIGNEGGLENTLRQNQGLRLSTYLFNGILTNRVISEKHQLPFQDLDLLLATLR
jgi:alanine dehydrogenase